MLRFSCRDTWSEQVWENQIWAYFSKGLLGLENVFWRPLLPVPVFLMVRYLEASLAPSFSRVTVARLFSSSFTDTQANGAWKMLGAHDASEIMDVKMDLCNCENIKIMTFDRAASTSLSSVIDVATSRNVSSCPWSWWSAVYGKHRLSIWKTYVGSSAMDQKESQKKHFCVFHYFTEAVLLPSQ